jgi:hypothetical protein
MTFDAINFLQSLKQIETGTNVGQAVDGGFLRDLDISPQLVHPLLASTGVSTFGPFQIPRAYDQESDQLQFRFLGSTAGTGTSAISLIGSINIFSTGAIASVVSPVQTATTTVNNGQISNIGWAIQGAGLQYPDAFTLTLSTSGGNYQVMTGAIVISDTLVAWADYNQNGTVAAEQVGASTQQIRTA